MRDSRALTGSNIFALVKIFDVQEYAEAFFLRGLMHMKTVSWFRQMEDDGTGRADPDDGVDHLHQPELINLFIGDPNGKQVMIPGKHLAGPIKVRDDATTESHIFCSYAVSNPHLDLARDGNPVLDQRIADLGGFAVFVRLLPEFMDRFASAAADAGLGLRRAPVEYLDVSTHDGELGPFKKDLRFAYQHEYRLMVDGTGQESLDLEIGSLVDVAHCIPGAKLGQFLYEMLRQAPEHFGRGGPPTTSAS